MSRQQRNTLILALALLAALGAGFLIQRLWLHDQGGRAIVQVEGQEDITLALSRDREFQVGDEHTGYNLIQVKDGTVRVVEADCPDKVCVHTGPIRQEGQVIACLPHKVVIYIPRKGG